MRFPEFTEEWRSHFLTDFMSFKNGMNPDAKRFGRGTKFISVMDILNNQFICYDNIRASVEVMDGDIDTYGVNYGDILFQRSSETLEDVGQANVYLDSKPAIFGGFVIRGKSKGNYNPLFFRYLLASPTARKRIIVKGAGAQHFNIGQDGLSKVSLDIPCMQEQKKIGELLQCIDARIATQNKIIEDLKKLKSAIVDKLFCLPNELVPQMRLHGFTGNWTQVRLSDVCQRIRTKNINTQCQLVLTIAAQYGLVSQEDFFNKSVASDNLESYYLIEKDDFAYNKSYSTDYPWGAVKRLELYSQGVLSPLYICFRANTDVIVPDYLSHYFESKKWHKGIADIAGEGARNHGLLNLSVVDFFNTTHRIPSMPEQKVIADVLNKLTFKYNLERKLHENLLKQRNYLLQQMFI
ncbi:restriction endonuclease subunit S [Bacteroides fragilis]|uniref:restriction endonuclease subunit S n=1 Tax=uncultured Bacteroides sp. TaxID=162156 RepID=UPI0025E1A2B4|nr:restriction endonuclease subunit S [uncultured Bacteroides sp.]MCS2613542.1 restriction endonuclease subunit S [Bacteroides fragilis]MCS2879150.1 restriction endonuclease subunit S [Bacteroides fragilis]